MRPLPTEDAFHLNAAEGWLDLGNASQAEEQVANIAPHLRTHPEVLEMRCRIYGAEEKWDKVLMVAEVLTEKLPNRPMGWLMIAAAEAALGDTEGAYETLCSVAAQFAEQPEVTYELARYAAMHGDWEACGEWLAPALEAGGPELMKKALDDPALKGFWERMK